MNQNPRTANDVAVRPFRQRVGRRRPARTAACFALLCAAVLALGGCAQSRATSPQHHYALGELASPVTAGDHQPAASNGKVLGITPIAVPPWLTGTGFFYQLAYEKNNRLAAYAYSDWVAPPATLLEPLVRDALTAASGWQAVVGPDAPAEVDASLHLRLKNFSQVFTQPKHSVGVVEMAATLIDSHSGRVQAQKNFRVEVAAPTPDAEGGARALGEASRQLISQLLRWIQSVSTRQGK